MLDENRHRIKVIQAKDPAIFERQYNTAADELDQYDPDITVKIESGVYYALFTYTLHKPVPESIKDEFTLAGIHHTCSECPYLEIGTDCRRKNWPCKYSEYGTANAEGDMCELMLKRLMAGTVRLRGTEGNDNDD